jgi:hypothetical protein
MPPNDTYNLIPKICECYFLWKSGLWNASKELKIRKLSWISGLAQCNHRSPYKSDFRLSDSKRRFKSQPKVREERRWSVGYEGVLWSPDDYRYPVESVKSMDTVQRASRENQLRWHCDFTSIYLISDFSRLQEKKKFLLF